MSFTARRKGPVTMLPADLQDRSLDRQHAAGRLSSWHEQSRWARGILAFAAIVTIAGLMAPVLRPDKKSDVPEGFAIDVKASEADVLKAVQIVTQDTILHGTQVYSREDMLTDAEAVASSSYYGPWEQPGHAFYKVRRDALAPRHFKDSADIGTIWVRYVVLGVSPNQTHIQIDAVFVEDASKRIHISDTTVETSEFAEIQAHIVEIQHEERRTADALQRRQLQLAAQSNAKERAAEAAKLKDGENSIQSMESRLHELQHQAELRVKAPANLKSAPFQHAATLQSVPANSDVLIEIITPYWYGVETVDGHRGWLRHDQVEPIP
jgi:hypothetical protein